MWKGLTTICGKVKAFMSLHIPFRLIFSECFEKLQKKLFWWKNISTICEENETLGFPTRKFVYFKRRTMKINFLMPWQVIERTVLLKVL